VNAALSVEAGEDWSSELTELRIRAAAADLPHEARLLFDLQNVCIDVEKPIYAVEAMESLLTRGKKPVKRELAQARDCRILRHLRSAARHADIVRDTNSPAAGKLANSSKGRPTASNTTCATASGRSSKKRLPKWSDARESPRARGPGQADRRTAGFD